MTYAGFWKRLAGSFIDEIVLVIGYVVNGFVFGMIVAAAGIDDPDVPEGLMNILLAFLW